MRYDLEDVFGLSDLTDICICDDRLSYMQARYLHDIEQYKNFCSVGSLDVAQLALDDAENDLENLLYRLDPTFERGDAEFLNRLYLQEFMNGWQY